MRKTILHVIDSLSLGGAETLLVNTVNNLVNYDNIIVTLNDGNELKNRVLNAKVISLAFKSKFSLPGAIIKLRKIIKENQVDIVHSHLFWSTVIARLATPNHVKFIFSVHSILSQDAFNLNKWSKYLEKLTYKPYQHAIFVSNAAREDYDKHIGLKGDSHVLYNFISPEFFEAPVNRLKDLSSEPCKLVAVGNLKEVKNYFFLIEAFKILKRQKIKVVLDIYGEGNLRRSLQKEIEANDLPIVLKGSTDCLNKILPLYNVFVMTSSYEGFGLAALEAMACGLPVFLSDIEAFREVSNGQAIFFNHLDPLDFVNKIIPVAERRINLTNMAEAGRKHAFAIAGKENYLKKLLSIYNRQ